MSGVPSPRIEIAEQLPVYKPVRPEPVKLKDPSWRDCGKDVCLTREQAKLDLRNKLAVAGWMGEMNGIVDYYESTVQNSNSPGAIALPVK